MEEGASNGDGAPRSRRSAILKRKRVVGKAKDNPDAGMHNKAGEALAHLAQYQTYQQCVEPATQGDDQDEVHAVVDGSGYESFIRNYRSSTATGDAAPAIYNAEGGATVPLAIGVASGKAMCVVYGRHFGLRATIVQVLDGRAVAVVELQPSRKMVEVHVDELGEIGSISEERALTELRMVTSGCSSIVLKHLNLAVDEEPWLKPLIRVRVVDKVVCGGKLYLQTGSVMDVLSQTSCIVLLEETTCLLKRKQLEPAVPAAEGRVLVLRGEHEGLVGKLVQKQDSAGSAVIQLEQSFQIVAIGLDSIAEYLGD